MSSRYQSLIRTPVGQLLAKNLGLPNPVRLERYEAGAPLVDGTVILGGEGRLGDGLVTALDDLGIAHVTTRARTVKPASERKSARRRTARVSPHQAGSRSTPAPGPSGGATK